MVLSDLCPIVQMTLAWDVGTWGYNDDDHIEEQREKWQEVAKLSTAFTRVRLQEREYMNTVFRKRTRDANK